jgi:hypothetical protein
VPFKGLDAAQRAEHGKVYAQWAGKGDSPTPSSAGAARDGSKPAAGVDPQLVSLGRLLQRVAQLDDKGSKGSADQTEISRGEIRKALKDASLLEPAERKALEQIKQEIKDNDGKPLSLKEALTLVAPRVRDSSGLGGGEKTQQPIGSTSTARQRLPQT